jgi:hypothetical protein
MDKTITIQGNKPDRHGVLQPEATLTKRVVGSSQSTQGYSNDPLYWPSDGESRDD